ncbi:MAG: MATE family efflux transporter [Lachnospiraceae bacterium]|nr:MATE family efflux transporter [Lachnospiraceae bacterium]
MSILRKRQKQSLDERFAYLTQTPIPQLISTLAVPTIISMLVTGIYNSADTFFVGRISTQATAAVGLVFSVMAIIQALGFFCGQGSGTFLSRMMGAGDMRRANEMSATGFAISLIIGVCVAAVGNVLAVPLARMLGAGETTMHDTLTYMRIILIGAPFMTGQFVLNNQLRYQGSAFYSMIGLLTGAILNMALDPILMFGFHLGVAGAALATVSGQIISFFVLLAGTRKGENVRPRLKNVRLNRYYLRELINGGIPSLFRQGLAAVATILLNQAAGAAGGDAAIAGMSIVTRALMLVSSALIGFGQGFQPVASFNFGAGKKERVRAGYLFCVKVGTIFLTIGAAFCLIFAPAVITFFRDDPDVVSVGIVALRAQAITLPLLGLTVMTNMLLQSIGEGFKASITSAARSGIFFIPLILILPRLFGLFGVEITQACADALTTVLVLPMAIIELRKLKDNE